MSDRLLKWSYGAGLALAAWLAARQRRRAKLVRAYSFLDDFFSEMERGLREGTPRC